MTLNTRALNTATLNGGGVVTYIEVPAHQLVSFKQFVVFRVNASKMLVEVDQTVNSWTELASSKLIQFKQNVNANYSKRNLIQFSQRVYDSDSPVAQDLLPQIYVYINGKDVTSDERVRMDSITISHGEGVGSTARLAIQYDDLMPVDITYLNGKPIDIFAVEDRSDINSPTWKMFTGWINDSTYNRTEGTVSLSCTDLREERLGAEDPDTLLQITQAVYSEATQREGAEGYEFVTDMMRTVSGDIGYDRYGNLYYYTWGTNGKTIDRTLGGEIESDQISVDFQTRSDIVNVAKINFSYRYTALRTVKSTVEAIQHWREWGGNYAASFSKEDVISTIESGFSPWIATEYELVEEPTHKQATQAMGAKYGGVSLLVYAPNPWRCMGYKAKVERYIAQPVTENWTITVKAPQSINAYGREVVGTVQTYAVDSDYDRSDWEETTRAYKPITRLSRGGWYQWPVGGYLAKKSMLRGGTDPQLVDLTSGGKMPVIDDNRPLVTAGMRAAYLAAVKEIVGSHRKNYIDVQLYGLHEWSLGEIVEIDNRIISTIGQCTGVTYTLSTTSGLRTDIKIQVSSMDDNSTPPSTGWYQPPDPKLSIPDNYTQIPAKRIVNSKGSVNFDRESVSLNGEAPEVPEIYTNEAETSIEVEYEVALENKPITLIHGW